MSRSTRIIAGIVCVLLVAHFLYQLNAPDDAPIVPHHDLPLPSWASTQSTAQTMPASTQPSGLDGLWKDAKGARHLIDGPDGGLFIIDPLDPENIHHVIFMPGNLLVTGNIGNATVKSDMSELWWSNPAMNPPWVRVKAKPSTTTAP